MPASFKHLTDKKSCYNSLLAKWTDGLYYTAALIKCDKPNKRCRVYFEDGSEIWVSNQELHIQLSIDQLSDDEDIVCCICDDGNSEAPNEIILCDVCQQGYHQLCHQPKVDSSTLDESEDTKDHKDWFCATCSYILNQTNHAKPSAQQPQQQTSQQQKPPQQQSHFKATKSESSQQARPAKPKQEVPQASSKAAASSSSLGSPKLVIAEAPRATPAAPKQAPKVKQTPTAPQQQAHRSTVGSIKPSSGLHQRSAPYYPLSSQVRAGIASPSTAALASMTASSALVVGSAAGRSKQDLVKQGNKSTQRHNDINIVEPPNLTSPPKHAVRKSSINFIVSPVRQSALPTATRSIPSPGTAAAALPSNGNKVIASSPAGAATTTTPIISPTKTTSSTVSMLTDPTRSSDKMIMKHSDIHGAAATTTSNVVRTSDQRVVSDSDGASNNNGPSSQLLQRQPCSPAVSSSDAHVNVSNTKVITDLDSKTQEARQVNEVNVHSTSGNHQNISSLSSSTPSPPQLEIIGSSPEQQQQSPNVPRNDLNTNNGTGESKAPPNKTAAVIVVSK